MSNAKPSLFAYPAPTKPPKKETITKVATAVLSTTAKAKAREKRKAAEQGEALPVSDFCTASPRIPANRSIKDDKKDGDVEMKGADASTSQHGDVSPISLAEGSPKPRKSEPTSEKLSNFSRVTPAQLAYISFSPENRFQPVRVVSTRPPPSSKAPKTPASVALATERYAGGGGILIMSDTRADEECEYIEFETQPVAQPAPGVVPQGNPPAPTPGRHIALDENAPEADPPESFEVRTRLLDLIDCLAKRRWCSTPSIMIRRWLIPVSIPRTSPIHLQSSPISAFCSIVSVPPNAVKVCESHMFPT